MFEGLDLLHHRGTNFITDQRLAEIFLECHGVVHVRADNVVTAASDGGHSHELRSLTAGSCDRSSTTF